MPTSRNPYERMEFWRQKDNGTLYMNEEQLRQRVGELMDEVKDLRQQLAECQSDLEVSETKFAQTEFIIADLTKRQGELTNLITMKDARILELALENTALTKQLAECKQRLAEASVWKPLPDGLHFIEGYSDAEGHITASLGGSLIEIHNGTTAIQLDPCRYRLCQRTPGTSAQEVESETHSAQED